MKWDDFLDSFDEAQPDVKVNWGPKPKNDYTARRRQQSANLDKLLGKGIKKPPQVKLEDQERITKLEALINNKAATDGEKAAARAALNRIKGRYKHE